MAIDLSLVLACYNEEPWLERSVREIVRVLDSFRQSYEIIFVDDASIDRTPEIIRKLAASGPEGRFRAIFHEHNTGRGRSVADGMRGAAGEIVGFIDVDLEVHPLYISSCCEAIRQGVHVAVGSRVFKFAPGGLWRRFLSMGYAMLVRMLLPIGGRLDTESGCKFFLRKAILPVLDNVMDSGWFWDTEIMVRSRLAGLVIAEVPCLYIRNPGKPSSVRVVRDIFASLARLHAFRGRLKRDGMTGSGGA